MSTSLYGKVSTVCGQVITRSYSTSFSLGVRCLSGRFRDPVHSIYGFVRIADEIVDSFTDKDRELLLDDFESDTYKAIDQRVSSNPVLEAFQRTVHSYGIQRWTIDRFLSSMRMDLHQKEHDRESFDAYVLGSAEAVGLMCLRIFSEGNEALYQELAPQARSLGAAFQKINFLRDLREDREDLERDYFPETNEGGLSDMEKARIEREIEAELRHAYEGVLRLPKGARFGVYIAYVYFRELFRKIQCSTPERVEKGRIRIPNAQKFALFISSCLRYRTLST